MFDHAVLDTNQMGKVIAKLFVKNHVVLTEYVMNQMCVVAIQDGLETSVKKLVVQEEIGVQIVKTVALVKTEVVVNPTLVNVYVLQDGKEFIVKHLVIKTTMALIVLINAIVRSDNVVTTFPVNVFLVLQELME